MKKNYKITFIVLFVLALVAVISSVSVAFVLTDKLKMTGDALTRLRSLMTGTALNIEPITAYIIPSDDPHQVCKACTTSESCLMLIFGSAFYRVNTLPRVTVDVTLSLALQAQLGLQLSLNQRHCYGLTVVIISKRLFSLMATGP